MTEGSTHDTAVRPEGSWTCPICSQTIGTRYCSTCGERPMRPHELTLRGLLDQVTQTCTNIDGPLIRSVRRVVRHPGALTLAYLSGERKPYTLPLPLFLFANLLFFGMQSLVGAKVFSTPLDSHLHNYFWSDAARQLVARRMEAKGTSLAQYTPVFNQAVELNAKSLIVLMVVPFSILLALVFYRCRRPAVGHIVFSLHFYTFLLLLFCIALAAVAVDLMLGGGGLNSERFDHGLSILLVAVCALYLYAATRTVYGGGRAVRALQVIPLVLAASGIVLGYRFVLLLITLYTT